MGEGDGDGGRGEGQLAVRGKGWRRMGAEEEGGAGEVGDA